MSYIRFSDREDNREIIRKSQEFRERSHGLPPTYIMYGFVLLIVIIIVFTINLGIRFALLPDDIPTLEVLGFLACTLFLVTVAVLFSSAMISKIRRVISSAEFLCLVFSSSMRLGTNFCAIVNKEKDVIYYDQNFDVIFPGNPNYNNDFRRLIDNEFVQGRNAEKIIDAVVNSVKTEIIASFDGNAVKVVVEPLPKPIGYSLIRGYGILV